MSSHVWEDEGTRLDGDLRGVAELDHHTGRWVDQVAAHGATEKGLREGLIRLEAGPDVELLLQPTAAARALEPTVQAALGLSRRPELVFVALDEACGDLWVHLLEGH